MSRFVVALRRARLGRSLALPSLALPGLAIMISLCPRMVAGQASVFDIQSKPFVVGIIPVVGRGGVVGGVAIDAQGIVSRTGADEAGRLREARLKALADVGGDLAAASPLRKVSLAGLAAALDEQRRKGLPPTDEMQFLAGLTRVEYVFVYPERRDIVLAGPAEGWRIDEQGHVVGRTSGRPVLQLDDLVVALRAAKEQLTSGELITCSIDPTEEGMRRFSRLVGSSPSQPTPAVVARLEKAAGPQQITLTGVPAGSHFAHVLVAADFLMKRLGMNLEAAPVEGLPSYMELLQADSGPPPKGAMPRWWMAPRYDPLARDEAGLAWQLRGPGVQTLSEEGRLGRGGQAVATPAKKDSPTARWAAAMTARYEALAAELPVFAELRNCMDLAVIGALFAKEDLPGRAGCDLGLLMDAKRLAVAEYHVPKAIDSRASLVRKDRQWIISVSGGVEIDSWSVLDSPAVEPSLADARKRSAAGDGLRWWWD